MTPLRIDNPTARALWLTSHGLAQTPTGPLDTLGLIKQLGFVQLDTIQVISRAHHHILWSRNQNYREDQLGALLRPNRQVFEHFTHDASVLPMDFLPMWQRQFERKKHEVSRSSWFGKHLDADLIADVTRRIDAHGPVSTHDFDTKREGEKAMWQRPPHKMVLDYLWYAGVLATSHRVGFTKYYDLAERVFPQDLPQLADEVQIKQLCETALQRLGFGTLNDIRKFWDACSLDEVKAWAANTATQLVPVEIEDAKGGWAPAVACPDIEQRIASLKQPTTRLRIINPFDPAIRDRARLERLFGFDYRVEMFVPAAQRQWGYYVYPLLEGGNFVGRIEAKGDRKQGHLSITQFWPHGKFQLTAKRQSKLEAELARIAKLAGLSHVVWAL